jgi:hypothetical protein
MLRDNLAGLIEPMLSSAGAYPLALGPNRKELSDDRPQNALKIPARQGGIYALTENVASPFHAEPGQSSYPEQRRRDDDLVIRGLLWDRVA